MKNHIAPTLLCKFVVKLVCNFFNGFESTVSYFFATHLEFICARNRSKHFFMYFPYPGTGLKCYNHSTLKIESRKVSDTCSLITASLTFGSVKSSKRYDFFSKIEFNIAQKTYLTAYFTGSARINQLPLVPSVAFWKRYFCWTKNSEHLTSLSDRQPSSHWALYHSQPSVRENGVRGPTQALSPAILGKFQSPEWQTKGFLNRDSQREVQYRLRIFVIFRGWEDYVATYFASLCRLAGQYVK